MKVQYIKEKVFTPVNLHITFETKEEYDAFYDMLQYDASICNIVYGKNYAARCTLQDVLIGIFRVPLNPQNSLQALQSTQVIPT